MRKILSTTAIFVAMCAVSAQAADLPRRKGAPEPYYANPVPTFTWSGLYVGANAGYGFGKFTGAGGTRFGDASNGFIGLTGGYNYQAANVVLGVEGDFAWTNMKDRRTTPVGVNTFNGAGRISSFGALRGRLGFTFDRALVYATAGFAGANMKGNSIVTNGVPAVIYSGSGDNFHLGWALGAGVEYAVTRNISVKGEYIYASLNRKTYFSAPYNVSAGASLNLLRGGVNYRF